MKRHLQLILAAISLIALTRTLSAQPLQPIQPMVQPHNYSQRAVFNPYPSVSPNPNVTPGPNARPPISQYLNLLRGGDAAVNYYLQVVPALQKQKRESDPAITPTGIDPRLDEEFRDIAGRRSSSGNLSSFMNYYGTYSLPNQRGYLPYYQPNMARVPVQR